MSWCCKIFLFIGAILPIILYLFINDRLFAMPDPKSLIPEPRWFGPGLAEKKPQFVRPFKVSVKESELSDLKKQLDWDSKHLAKPIKGINFNYGFNTDYLQDVIAYWRDKYDWRAVEKKINAMGKTSLDVKNPSQIIHVSFK